MTEEFYKKQIDEINRRYERCKKENAELVEEKLYQGILDTLKQEELDKLQKDYDEKRG